MDHNILQALYCLSFDRLVVLQSIWAVLVILAYVAGRHRRKRGK